MGTDAPIGTDAQIAILMKEYDTLRAEILQRVQTRFALLGFVGVVAGLIVSGDTDAVAIAIVVALALALGAWVWLWLRVGIGRCAAHLTAIEASVNQLAGCELLTWEQKQAERRGWLRLTR